MTKSNDLIGVDNKLDDALMHYGVKGMKWGVRKDKDKDKPKSKSKSKTTIDTTKPKVKIKEEEPAAGGGGGKANTEEDDKRELEAINEVLESGRDMKFKEFTTLLRRRAEIQKRMDARNKPDDEKSSSRTEPTALDKIPSKGISIDQLVNLNSDLTTDERIARGRKRRLEREKRKGSAKHSDLLSVKMKDIASGNHLAHDEVESDLDDYLMHYGVKGMKWGVRKDDRGKIKSVAKRTPLRGKDEKGPIRDHLDANDYGGTKNHKAVARAYKTARPYVKQGLRNLNKDERYRDKDLTNEKSKLVKQYHKDVSDMVTSKLNMAAVVKAKRGDKLVPAMDYEVGKSNEPQIRELNSHNQFKGKATKSAAKIELEKDMNVGDAAIQVGKGLAKNALVYAAASQAVGAGIIAATGLELILPEYSNPITRSISVYDGPIEYTGPPRRVRHSDDEESGLTIVFDPIMGAMGQITDVTFDVLSDTVTQDEMALDDYLIHYGVKGMKWGVRKDGNPQGYQGGASKSKSKRKKPKSDTVNRIKSNLKKTAGNAKKTVSKITDRPKVKPKPKPKAKRELDVEKAEAEAHAIDARRDSSPSLFSPDTTKTMLTDRTRTGGMTDAELKATIQRMHLETAYAKLVRENTPKSTSQKLMAFAKETATDIAKQQVKRVAGEYAGNLVNKAIGKGLADAKDQKKKDDPKPKADAPRSESKPKPKAEAPKPEAPKPSPTTSPASEPKRPAPTWRPTPPGPGRPPNKPPASEPKRPAPTWRPTGSPRTTPNTSNYVFGDRGPNYRGTRRAQDIIDNHATVTVAELMERRRRRERR